MITGLGSDALDLVPWARAQFTDHIDLCQPAPQSLIMQATWGRQVQVACFGWQSAFARGKPAHSMHAPKQVSIPDEQQQERRQAHGGNGAGKKVGSMKNDAIPSQADHKVNRLMQPANEDRRIQSELRAETWTPGST